MSNLVPDGVPFSSSSLQKNSNTHFVKGSLFSIFCCFIQSPFIILYHHADKKIGTNNHFYNILVTTVTEVIIVDVFHFH